MRIIDPTLSSMSLTDLVEIRFNERLKLKIATNIHLLNDYPYQDGRLLLGTSLLSLMINPALKCAVDSVSSSAGNYRSRITVSVMDTSYNFNTI
ncbi:hypothetical protein TNCV_839621 [Trichonephila clavipes]|nr:hypothetical protein TNCV_839621 [Trichonephila clavipes]